MDTQPGAIEQPPAMRGRVALFFVVRYATPLLVLLAMSAGSVRPDARRLAWILTGQVAFALATHVIASRSPRAMNGAIWIGMLADTASIGALVAMTGGSAGPLVFLFTVHALAAGILLSSRAGLRAVMLGSAAIIAVDIATGPGTAVDTVLPSGTVAIAALWVIGGAATVFTGYNERELRRRNAELGTVRRITLDIERSLSLEEIFAHLCAGVAESFSFDATAVLLREGDSIRCAGSYGYEGALGRTIPITGRLAQAMANGSPTVVSGEHARADRALIPVVGERGFVAVPIAEDSLLIVSRSARTGGPGAVRASEIETLESLAHHVRLAIANARLHQHVARLAITDPLTGLWNHGEMQRRLQEEAGRLERYTALRGPDHALSFLLLDIDHFKKLNDGYGHPAGDAVLRAVARCVRTAVREFDIVARYGGEEFAVILPETGTAAAREVAERVRRAVAATPFPVGDGRQSRVTVSIGVSTTAANASPSQLVEHADVALYRSKDGGRNRVTHAGDPPDPNATVVSLATRRRRPAADASPARDAARRARARSSHPTRRIPRA